MKLNTSVSKIANSFAYVVSSEKSYNTPEPSAPSELSVSHHCLLRRLRCQQPADRCQYQHHHCSNQIHCHRPWCQSDSQTSDKVIRDQTGQHVVTCYASHIHRELSAFNHRTTSAALVPVAIQ